MNLILYHQKGSDLKILASNSCALQQFYQKLLKYRFYIIKFASNEWIFRYISCFLEYFFKLIYKKCEHRGIKHGIARGGP